MGDSAPLSVHGVWLDVDNGLTLGITPRRLIRQRGRHARQESFRFLESQVTPWEARAWFFRGPEADPAEIVKVVVEFWRLDVILYEPEEDVRFELDFHGTV